MFFIKTLTRLAQVIHDRAHDELYNSDKIQEELMKLQLRFEMDEISEEEYDRQEEALLERLDQARAQEKK